MVDGRMADDNDTSVKPDGEHKPAAVTERYAPSDASQVSDVKLATDVQLAEDSTGAAPSFRAPAPPPPGFVPRPPVRRDQRPPALPPGEKIDDFEVVRLLGRGAFGHVYLARQLSLDRLVALKVSANRGSEGRTMARLEHAHIVQVYSEKVDEATDQRLLCMQLVPGVGLEKIISSLGMQLEVERSLADTLAGAASAPATWRGSDVLAVIDVNASLPTALDPAALRDREALGEMDDVETTAWMGARLGEALDFAHQRGVLHRDIKPANILVSPYGRPMLADFNISSQQVDEAERDVRRHGGLHGPRASRRLQPRRRHDRGGRHRAGRHLFARHRARRIAPRQAAATLDRSAHRPGRPAPQTGGLSASEAALFAGRHARCPQDARTDHLPLPGRISGRALQLRRRARRTAGRLPTIAPGGTRPPAGHRHRALDHRPAVPLVRAIGVAAADRRQRDQHLVQRLANRRAPHGAAAAVVHAAGDVLQPGDLSGGIRTVRLGVCSGEADMARDAWAHATGPRPRRRRPQAGAAVAALGCRAHGSRLVARWLTLSGDYLRSHRHARARHLGPLHRVVYALRPDRARLLALRLAIRDPAGTLSADVG